MSYILYHLIIVRLEKEKSAGWFSCGQTVQKLAYIGEILLIVACWDISAIKVYEDCRLASVGSHPIDGVVVPSKEIAGRVILSRSEIVGFNTIKILGLVFIDGVLV